MLNDVRHYSVSLFSFRMLYFLRFQGGNRRKSLVFYFAETFAVLSRILVHL